MLEADDDLVQDDTGERVKWRTVLECQKLGLITIHYNGDGSYRLYATEAGIEFFRKHGGLLGMKVEVHRSVREVN
jgi:hypothetical protein